MLRTRVAVILTTILLGCAAFSHSAPAQPRLNVAHQVPDVTHRVKVAPGGTVRIAAFANFKADCTPAALPTITLAHAPEKGTITVKRGMVQIRNFGRCLSTEVPAIVAYYHAKRDASGVDTAVIDVKALHGKTVQRHHYRILIGSSGMPL